LCKKINYIYVLFTVGNSPFHIISGSQGEPGLGKSTWKSVYSQPLQVDDDVIEVDVENFDSTGIAIVSENNPLKFAEIKLYGYGRLNENLSMWFNIFCSLTLIWEFYHNIMLRLI